MRDFSVFYDQTLKPEDKTVELQAQALLKFLAHNFSHCNLDANFFKELLRRGRCVIFLDGLDEVKEDLRPTVVEVVEAFVHEFASDDQAHPNRYVVASRPEAYGGQTAFRQFQEVTVEPLDEDQVSDFVHRWYREVFRQPDGVLTLDGEREAAQKQDSLLQAIRDKPQVQALTDNPLLLTLVAMLHHRAQLPDSRVELYRDCIRLLLGMWDKSKAGEHLRQAYRDLTPPEVLSMDLDKRSYYLQSAAFWLLQAGLPYAPKPDWVREIAQRRKLQGETGWLEIFLEWAKGRGNLLEEVGDRQYRFRYHRTLQEYLAAGYLVSLEDEGVQITLSLIPNRDWWETLRLMVAATVNPNRQSDLMRRALVLPMPEGALLVASCLTEVSGVGLDPALTPTLRQRLVSIMTDVSLPAKETRAEAGHFLGYERVGDPRDEVRGKIPVVVPVSAGEYWLGSYDDNDQAYKDERPRCPVKLTAYWIGKYPVTNAQYRCFIDDKGYETERFWTPEGWAWRQGKYTPDASVYDEQYRETIRRWVEGRKERDQPYYWKNVMWNISNHPVVGVTWFEATAYCAWLTEQLRQSDYRLPTGELAARLPTEAEWEAAARGPAGYEWPWGNTFDPQLANTSESEIEQTTAVGQYLLGASPCAALDMAGNVWEWCQSLYQPYPYQLDDGRENISASGPRVLRGGSWNYDRRLARCAYRAGLDPDSYLDFVGFRLVLSPQL